MSKVERQELIHGKMGPLIYYVVNGKQYVRTSPAKVKHRNSVAQKGTKERFKLAMQLAKLIYNRFATWYIETDDSSKRPFFQLQSLVRRTGIDGEYPNLTWNWESLLITEGSLSIPEVEIVQKETGPELLWNVEPIPQTATFERFVWLAIHKELKDVAFNVDDYTKGKLVPSLQQCAFPLNEYEHYLFRMYTLRKKRKVSTSKRIILFP